jgi:hypothetical protein
MSTTQYVTHPELEAALSRLELSFEKTVHAQTRQMFNLLLPVYGGIIIGLLFIASKVV